MIIQPMLSREQMLDHPPQTPADRVHLRDVTPGDLPELFRMQSDPESARMAVVHPRTPQAFADFWASVLANPSVVAKAIVLDEAILGTISCFRMEDLDFIGYWIDRPHWGRGIASRSLALLLAEVTKRPLNARAATTNTGSIRVLERCGFKQIGTRNAPADDRFPACEEAIFLLD